MPKRIYKPQTYISYILECNQFSIFLDQCLNSPQNFVKRLRDVIFYLDYMGPLMSHLTKFH